MGKKGKNTAKKKVAREEAKAGEKTDREVQRGLPARLDASLVKAQEGTKDIDLFADPPTQDDCPICLHPHSLEKVCGHSLFWCNHAVAKQFAEDATMQVNRRLTKSIKGKGKTRSPCYRIRAHSAENLNQLRMKESSAVM